MFLFDALARRYAMVARRSVELTRAQRYLVATTTFHPSRERWRRRYYWKGQRALELRSRNSRRVLSEIEEPYDLVVQIFGLFRTRGAPYVIYIDNTIELTARHWPAWLHISDRELERLYAWERRLFRDSLHVFACGKPHADSVVSHYGMPDDRVSVVGGGANFEILPQVPDRGDKQVILFVGRDWRRKGGDRLIEAFRQVRTRLPDARLVILGTEEAPREEPGVEVLGQIYDRSKIAELYKGASVFCLPSRFDPYGLSISEAMAYGLPCVVTRVGALDEVVLDGRTGFVIPPDDSDALADALERLLGDPELATRLGRAGRRRVEEWQNWDAVAGRMEPGLASAAAAAARL
jgi:glycosyltransferase involved in cell wall biosynthesis